MTMLVGGEMHIGQSKSSPSCSNSTNLCSNSGLLETSVNVQITSQNTEKFPNIFEEYLFEVKSFNLNHTLRFNYSSHLRLTSWEFKGMD